MLIWSDHNLGSSSDEAQERLRRWLRFPLFRQLPAPAVAKLVALASERSFESGACLVEEGAPSGSLLLFLRGCLRVSSHHDDRLATIHAPAMIGELEWLTRGPRAITVHATSQVVALVLFFDELDRVVREDMRLAMGITHALSRLIAERLQKVQRRLFAMRERNPALRELDALQIEPWTAWPGGGPQ